MRCLLSAASDRTTSSVLAMNIGYGHPQRTKIRHIPSCHVEMLGSDIAIWQICCIIVVSLSVGGVVQHVRSRCPCSGVWLLTLLAINQASASE